MAVKDGAGPRPVAQSAKRYSLNRETEVQNRDVQGPCRRAKTRDSCGPSWGPRTPVAGLKHHGSEGRACVVLQLAFVLHGSGQGTPLAGLKHHGSEGRSGPAARSPECQMLLSEPTRN